MTHNKCGTILERLMTELKQTHEIEPIANPPEFYPYVSDEKLGNEIIIGMKKLKLKFGETSSYAFLVEGQEFFRELISKYGQVVEHDSGRVICSMRDYIRKLSNESKDLK